MHALAKLIPKTVRIGLRSQARRWKLNIESYLAAMPAFQRLAQQFRSRERVFGRAYTTNAWGSPESKSGSGSELGATVALRSHLPELFQQLDVKTFLDAPCGDWNWMQEVDLTGVDYCGVDVAPGAISRNQERFSRAGVRFLLADLAKDYLPKSDLILCRDCWVHLSFEDIAAMLENFRRSGSTWLLVSNTPSAPKNINKFTGLDWRHLNLALAPFDFPSPKEAL